MFELGRRGAKVIIGCRDVEKSRKVAETARTVLDAEVVVEHLDLADNESVRKFAEKCLEEERIDILVNNAGLMMPKEGAKTKQGFEVRTRLFTPLGEIINNFAELVCKVGQEEKTEELFLVAFWSELSGPLPANPPPLPSSRCLRDQAEAKSGRQRLLGRTQAAFSGGQSFTYRR